MADDDEEREDDLPEDTEADPGDDIGDEDLEEENSIEDDLIEEEFEDTSDDEDDEDAVEDKVVDDDETDDDDDDVADPDDVEADLDSILKERLVVAEDEDEEEEEEVADPEDRSDGRVRPRAPGEFVCQSCFLVKHPSQLADAKRQLCADCV